MVVEEIVEEVTEKAPEAPVTEESPKILTLESILWS